MKPMLRSALAGAVLGIGAGTAGAIDMVVIRSLESGATFVVQFNAKEVTIQKTVPWKNLESATSDTPRLEFAGSEPRTLQVQLLFDNFESSADVHQAFVQPLEHFAKVDPSLGRPPLIQFEWGAFPAFRGVIEKLDVKYTLFLADGTPVRATVDLTLKEATRVRASKGGGATPVTTCQVDADCPTGKSCFSGACAPSP